MIDVYKLTKRHIDGANKEKLAPNLKEIKLFSTSVGHGVGTIDFSQKLCEISDDEWRDIVENSGKYAKQKLSGVDKYYEIEIFKEHKPYLVDMAECDLKNIVENLNEGYLVVRKRF